MASTSAASAAAATESRPPIDRLIAGGAAGALSRFTTAPIDRVKLLIQVNATSYRGGAPIPTLNPSSAWSVASRIAKEEGAVALWRGTGAAVVRILPYSATTFAVFPAYVDALNAAFGVRGDDVSSGRTVAARFLAGALAGSGRRGGKGEKGGKGGNASRLTSIFDVDGAMLGGAAAGALQAAATSDPRMAAFLQAHGGQQRGQDEWT